MPKIFKKHQEGVGIFGSNQPGENMEVVSSSCLCAFSVLERLEKAEKGGSALIFFSCFQFRIAAKGCKQKNA